MEGPHGGKAEWPNHMMEPLGKRGPSSVHQHISTCPHLKRLIIDSRQLRHRIEKAKTMLVRPVCFNVSLSGLP